MRTLQRLTALSGAVALSFLSSASLQPSTAHAQQRSYYVVGPRMVYAPMGWSQGTFNRAYGFTMARGGSVLCGFPCSAAANQFGRRVVGPYMYDIYARPQYYMYSGPNSFGMQGTTPYLLGPRAF